MNNIKKVDCIAGMNAMKAESVDLIVSSPPYNIGKNMKLRLLWKATYPGNAKLLLRVTVF